MAVIEVNRGKVAVGELPGGRPEELPVQPLEGTAEALAHVARVMQAAEDGQRVRLSFFGASHTEGDFWTGQIRRLLQARYGDLGHGFVFPAAIAKGYRNDDINLCRTEDWKADYAGNGSSDGLYGFAGGSVRTDDPADFGWLETTRTNPRGRLVSRYEVFTLGQPTGGTLLLTVDDLPPRAVSTLAESPVLQQTTVLVPDGPHRLELRPLGDGEIRVFGVSAEREGPGVLVDSMGIRGRTARTWLAWQPEMAAEGLTALHPDLVVLAYGTNEANDLDYTLEQYRSDLAQVLERLRRGAPDAACILVGPSDRGKELSKGRYAIWDRTAPFAEVQREVAPDYGCAFWDWQAATGGPGSMIAWRLHDPQLAARDLIHFTQKGYEWSAERLVEAMDQTRAPGASR